MARHRLVRRLRQRGISLIFALLSLVVISLAAVALVRSVDTSSLVIGNLGFKQDATAAASQAAEQAIAWLWANRGETLHNDRADAGYYAASRDALDPTGHRSSAATRAVVDWNDDDCDSYPSGSFAVCVEPSGEISLNGGANRARYVITRLCATEGSPATVDCAFPVGTALSGGGNKGEINAKSPERLNAVGSSQQYYRIVVRALSARGTASFTETIVQL
ncbi:pilus assembly PilX family protein [Azohydromonas sediminis]|uniref:pilus assembly PilX family protein n=1 Tax=Azohydromonas sediminis TaxID=2259674 RepID=UPI000E64808D|nr:pilus assembly protein PilX [Azohydromonas sediminis]